MNRRDMLQLVMAAAPGTSALAQISTTADWKPQFFNAHQDAMIVQLSELIIPATDTPGAKAAYVNRWMDRLFTAVSRQQQEEFTKGLAWLDDYCQEKYSRDFVQLTEPEQVAILTLLDKGGNAAPNAGEQFFRLMKSMTSRIYYATEIGMKELNKGGRVPAALPVCTHQHG